MSETLKEFLTVAEVAVLLGLRPVTIYRWCRAGRLAGVKIGKAWRIRRTALDELLQYSPRDRQGRCAEGGEQMHEASLETRNLARQLLRQHAGEDRGPAALARATEHASARLRGRLVPLIGRIGFTALLRRALRLARGEFPALADLSVDEGADPGLAGAREFAALHADDAALVEAALTALLAQLITLLDTFIGEPLTRRVIDEGWPIHAAAEEKAL